MSKPDALTESRKRVATYTSCWPEYWRQYGEMSEPITDAKNDAN